MIKAIVAEPKSPKPANAIRLMCFSDTHGKIDYIPEDQIYPCDVLIFAGDFSNFGNPEEVHNFVNWIDKHGARDNIVISGNSELPFETKKLEIQLKSRD